MAAKNQSIEKQNVIKYRKPFNFNVGMIIFLIIFLYIVFSVYAYLTRAQIRFYEVPKGGIVKESSFAGIAVREETVETAQSSGYIHYYVQEGKRVAAGASIYTIDETGSMEKYLSEHPELTTELSDDQLSDIRYRLSAFSENFQNENFSALYDIKSTLDAAALEYSGVTAAEDLDQVLSEMGISYTRVSSDTVGVVSYTVDGQEGLKAEDVTAALFDESNEQKRMARAGELVEAGQPVCKLVTDASWSIVFPLTDEEKTRYQDVKSVTVHFSALDLDTNATLSMFIGSDGASYGELTMNELMEDFISDRYIEFELKTDEETGLKIPLTAVTEKEFFVVPKSFLVQQADGRTGFLRRQADGSQDFVESEIYRVDEQYCYLSIPKDASSEQINTNDLLVKEGGDQTYSVGATKTIQGVYNINKGYAVFRQIVPVESTNEYLIVEENTDYGISVYDHIVLDASLVTEGQIIYQ